jgi:hypothetical protein
MDISDIKKSVIFHIGDIFEIMNAGTYKVSSHSDWYSIHNLVVEVKKKLLTSNYKHKPIKRERRWIVNKTFKKE